MSLLRITLCIVTLSAVGCASYFKRKECEKTNWFEYGKQIAMKGERTTGNGFIMECEKVDANIDHAAISQGFKSGRDQYCTIEQVFITGKSGEFFGADLCDGPEQNRLKKRHAEGVVEYCKVGNGYSAGAKGKPYNNICPKNMESDFLPEFRRGRKVYLTALINEKERETEQMDRDIDNLNRQRSSINYQLQSLGSGKKITREMKYDPVTKSYKEETLETEDPATAARRNDLMNQAQSIDSEISRTRSKQQAVREELRNLKTEAATL